MNEHKFFAGVKAGMSIAIGYFPVALAFGLLAKTTGLSIIEATAMSLIVFAGASQYIALSLIAASVNPWLIILNTFTVNIRHFLMTASLNEKMMPEKRWVKAIYSFFITDESFSILAMRKEEKLPTSFTFGVLLIGYVSWVSFTAIGHIIGANLPEFLQIAMSIALYAMFVGLLVPAMKGSRKIMLLGATGALFHCIIYILDLLSKGWAILVSALLAAILIELLYEKNGKNVDAIVHHRKEEV